MTDLFQRVVGVHADAEAHAQDAFLTRRQGGQDPRRGFAQIGLDGGVQRDDGVLVLDEVTQMAVFLIPDRGFEADRLLGDLQDLADLFERHAQLVGQFLGRRFATDLVQHLPRRADQLVDRLDHMHWDADGPRLVGDRARDRLPDPPGGVGGELVAAAVFELIDRLHQADIAFLDQVQELQAAIGVFLGDGDHEAEIGLDHLLLGPRAVTLAAADGHVDAAEFRDRQAGIGRDGGNLRADIGDVGRVLDDEQLPAAGRQLVHLLHPVRVELIAAIAAEEFFPRDLAALGHAHELAFQRGQTLVELLELGDQLLDPVVVQADLADLLDQFLTRLLVAFLGADGDFLAARHLVEPAVLHLVQLLVQRLDFLEVRENLGLQLFLERGERHGGAVAFLIAVDVVVGGEGGLGRGGGFVGFGHFTGRRAGPVGGFKVDDVAQQHPASLELVVPGDDRLEGQRAFAQPVDHHVAAGFDPLGDRDFALTRQQLDAAHFAQVHPDRVVGAA